MPPQVLITVAAMATLTLVRLRYSTTTSRLPRVKTNHRVQECATRCQCAWKLVFARSVDLPVLDLEKGREQFVGRMVEKAIEAVEEDGAHVIVLGCTGLAGLAEQVKVGLSQAGHEVPVVDPAATALKVAEALVGAGLAHSKRTYPQPPQKMIVGYE